MICVMGDVTMLKRILTAAAVAGGAMLLAGCETPSLDEGQCLSADWTTQGYQDAVAGRGTSRFNDHVEACAEHGVTPDYNLYHTGHIEGRRVWCRPANGFAQGRRGSGYNQGYCAADQEQAYMEALADGRSVYDARQFAETLQNRVYEAQARADSLAAQIRLEEDALGVEGLTEEQVTAIRVRIRNLRSDRDRELYEVGRLQSEADIARRDADMAANRFIPIYGG